MNGCSSAFLAVIATLCKRVIYFPGEVITHQGDYCQDLHIMEKGLVQYMQVKNSRSRVGANVAERFARMFEHDFDSVMDDQDMEEEADIVMCVTAPGTAIGAYSFIFGIKEPYEAVCSSKTVAIVISKEDFDKALKRFPNQVEMPKHAFIFISEISFIYIYPLSLISYIDELYKRKSRPAGTVYR